MTTEKGFQKKLLRSSLGTAEVQSLARRTPATVIDNIKKRVARPFDAAPTYSSHVDTSDRVRVVCADLCSPDLRAREVSLMSITRLLDEALSAVQVTPAELAEARRRRDQVMDALRKEFSGGRLYLNGSLAHGDAIDPLADFDVGVVVAAAEAVDFGPGKKSASELKERVRDAIRAALCDEFPDLRIEIEGRKRSVLIRFSDPVSSRAADFTGDVICALDHPDGGLYIPNFGSWDRSDPETHTRLVLDAIDRTEAVFARTIRLLKYWNSHHGRAFCSWHLKVLGMDAIQEPMLLIDALKAFFSTSMGALESGPTSDPADVGPDIETNTTMTEALKKLDSALGHVDRAIQAEETERPLRAQVELSALLPEIIDSPAEGALAEEDRDFEIDRLKFEIDRFKKGSVTGVGTGSAVVVPRSRGWGARRT